MKFREETMKKFLAVFALLSALILAVSCASDDDDEDILFDNGHKKLLRNTVTKGA